jgi:SNF2 family DNA or RNA helicase
MERVTSEKAAAKAERRRKIEARKKRIAAAFEAERNTCLIAGRLYRYQNDGVIFLQLTRKVILADDMGLGKTIESIEFFLREKRDGKFTKALIVVPASLKRQWKDEIERFAGDRFTITIIDGSAAKRKAQWSSSGDIIIVNYDVLPNDLGYGYLDGIEFSHIVLDEASYIKNYAAKRTIAIKKISKDIKSRLALTGTPLENDLDELWSIADFVNPKLFGSRDSFKEEYKILHNGHSKRKWYYDGVFKRYTVDEYRQLKVDRLRSHLQRVMIRRRKSEVLDQLPPLIKMRETVELDAPARVVHDEMYEQMQNLLHELVPLLKRAKANDESLRARINYLTNQIRARFVYLRELCLMPELIVHDEPVRNTKLERLVEILDEISTGNKIVIFTEFRRVALMLQGCIPGSFVVHGQIDKMKRPDILNEFKNSPDRNVLISTSVLTYGVNLQFANYIVNYDMHFNPAKMAQRVDRLHRIGQARSVTVLNLVTANSIEEKVESILARKHELFCSVIEGKQVDANFADSGFLMALNEAMNEAVSEQ